MKKYIFLFVLIFFTLLFGFSQQRELYRVNEHGVVSSWQADIRFMLPVVVNRVVDGDTIIVDIANPPAGLNSSERIRFLGIDAPEVSGEDRGRSNFGMDSADFVRSVLQQGRVIYLAFDWDLRDRYDRVLAYIYLENGINFNAYLIYMGFARAYTVFRFQFTNEFRQNEVEARSNRRGLWGI